MDPDAVGAVGALEGAGDGGAGGGALDVGLEGVRGDGEDGGRTMLPVSELARAKMKMALGQLPALPFSRSLRVFVPSWRAERVMGEAAARLASMERVRNFMVIDV